MTRLLVLLVTCLLIPLPPICGTRYATFASAEQGNVT